MISTYFPSLTKEQKKQFSELQVLVNEWNSKVNIISRKDTANILERHILHSLGIALQCEFTKDTTVLDVGTGGGFPGIPLAILFPDTHFHMVDSIGKKIIVVQDIIHRLGLTNAFASHQRAEDVPEQFDYIISRAVTRLNKFIPWIENKFKKNTVKNAGLYYLKGGDLTEELSEVPHKHKMINLSDTFNGEFFETKKVIHISAKEF
ncbi:MAG: 16S rRNA (guanine(527)-N(7))-methyltransferase RsmG [Cyclobacteriaceae bacterium]